MSVTSFLPTDWKLAWVVRADAMMVAVVGVADRGAAVVWSSRPRDAVVACSALQQPLADVGLQACNGMGRRDK